jgi:hypothetical protein
MGNRTKYLRHWFSDSLKQSALFEGKNKEWDSYVGNRPFSRTFTDLFLGFKVNVFKQTTFRQNAPLFHTN